MYFEVVAHYEGSKKRKENLDSKIELQEFANKVKEQGSKKMIIKTFDCQGFKEKFKSTLVFGYWKNKRIFTT